MMATALRSAVPICHPISVPHIAGVAAVVPSVAIAIPASVRPYKYLLGRPDGTRGGRCVMGRHAVAHTACARGLPGTRIFALLHVPNGKLDRPAQDS